MKVDLNHKNDAKIEKEKEIVKLMIMKYCRGYKHLNPPCKDCKKLIEYVERRADLCPFMETKTYCSNCQIHCYSPDKREKIKAIMRYSGPRMLFSNPIITIDHIYQGIKYKLKQK